MKNHKWISEGTFQASAILGDSRLAFTTYHCEYCNSKVNLYYNQNETWEHAMDKTNVLHECSSAPEQQLTGKEAKIFCFANGGNQNGVSAVALGEDGMVAGSHFCSNVGWAKIDLWSDNHQKKYRELYPDGYELIWIDDVNDERILSAVEKNKQLEKTTTDGI